MSYPTRKFSIVAGPGASPVWICHPDSLRIGSEYLISVQNPGLRLLAGSNLSLAITMTIDGTDTIVASCVLHENYLHNDQRNGSLVFPCQEHIASLQKLFLAASAESGTTAVPVGAAESGCSARITVRTMSGVFMSATVGVTLANLCDYGHTVTTR